MLSDNDPEEKINFFFTGPNRRGMNTVIQQYYNKNYLFWEYDIPITGEYYSEKKSKKEKIPHNKDKSKFILNNNKKKKKNDKNKNNNNNIKEIKGINYFL